MNIYANNSDTGTSSNCRRCRRFLPSNVWSTFQCSTAQMSTTSSETCRKDCGKVVGWLFAMSAPKIQRKIEMIYILLCNLIDLKCQKPKRPNLIHLVQCRCHEYDVTIHLKENHSVHYISQHVKDSEKKIGKYKKPKQPCSFQCFGIHQSKLTA